MIYGKKDQSKHSLCLQPILGSSASERDILKYRSGTNPIEPQIAYQLIKDELMMKGA